MKELHYFFHSFYLMEDQINAAENAKSISASICQWSGAVFGVLLGFSEILFVFSLKEILNYFEIFKTKENLYLRYFNPIYLFLFFALLRLFISAVTYFWQIYLGNYFKFLVKKNVISYLYSENKNYGISIKDTGDLLTNIIIYTI